MSLGLQHPAISCSSESSLPPAATPTHPVHTRQAVSYGCAVEHLYTCAQGGWVHLTLVAAFVSPPTHTHTHILSHLVSFARSKAFSVTQSAMRVFSVATVSLSARFVGSTPPTTCLLIFSALLTQGGFLAIYLPRVSPQRHKNTNHLVRVTWHGPMASVCTLPAAVAPCCRFGPSHSPHSPRC